MITCSPQTYRLDVASLGHDSVVQLGRESIIGFDQLNASERDCITATHALHFETPHAHGLINECLYLCASYAIPTLCMHVCLNVRLFFENAQDGMVVHHGDQGSVHGNNRATTRGGKHFFS